MSLADMHREDVKAALRKRYGSVAAFERAFSLPEKSVTDLLRGYKSARVKEAVEGVINSPEYPNSEGSVDNNERACTHRLNAGVR